METQCCGNGQPLSEEELYKALDEFLIEYRDKPGGLIPVLQIAQNLFGYLPDKVLKKIAVSLDKPYSEVAGVVSFYSFFSRYPKGKYTVRVCMGTACYVRGGKEVLDSLKHHLEIDLGETTGDRMFSLEIGRCFGACGLAPVIMVNDTVHQRVKPDKVDDLIAFYKAQEKEEQIEEVVQ
ncbi:MAG: NAD(P)H-dependent oxidoreductase subunit E [Candidatus Kapaibacterium sp.]